MSIDVMYRLSPEEVERQLTEIIGNANLDEILLDRERVKRLNFEVGEFVQGRVVIIRNDHVYVDLSAKEEGRLNYFEDGFVNDDLDVGDEATFLVTAVSPEGTIQLSRKNVETLLHEREILATLQTGDVVTGTLIQNSKNGWIVDINGLKAFLPSSQEFLVIPNEGVETLIGTIIEAEVDSIENNSVTLTRKAFASQIKRATKANFIAQLQVADIVPGTIKNLTDFGVFIQIAPGIIGFCHVSDAGKQQLEPGQQVKCRILKIDREKNRISLGLKQVTEPTWTEIISKYNIDDKVVATVKSIVPYGAFLEIEPGISGLVHVSDLSWSDHIKHPKEVLKEGEKVEVVILSIDPDKQHLSLGLKQVSADPWEGVTNKYFIGQSLPGRVVSKLKFGIFIELEKGLEGLAHHTVKSKNLKINDLTDVTILRIDVGRKKISLAIED